MNKKKKQHYVSQFYLRSWSLCGEKVFTLFDKPVPMSIKKIASSNYFYKVYSISNNTKKSLLKALESLKSPEISKTLLMMINAINIFDKLGNPHDDQELDKIDDKFRTNIVEDFYGMIEDVAAPELKKILCNELEEFDIESYQSVLRYSVYQLVRTQKLRDLFKNDVGDSFHDKDIEFNSYQIFLSLIVAEQLTMSLVERLYKIVVVKNSTAINFITNDNPAINLNAIEDKILKLYLPISPSVAIIIEPLEISDPEAAKLKKSILSGQHHNNYFLGFRDITIDEVEKFNAKLWANKHKYIYALESKDIEKHLVCS